VIWCTCTLWTGAPEIGERAPLLNEHPDTMFAPRYAGFAVIVYLKRLIRNWNLRDGYEQPSLLHTFVPFVARTIPEL